MGNATANQMLVELDVIAAQRDSIMGHSQNVTGALEDTLDILFAESATATKQELRLAQGKPVNAIVNQMYKVDCVIPVWKIVRAFRSAVP